MIKNKLPSILGRYKTTLLISNTNMKSSRVTNDPIDPLKPSQSHQNTLTFNFQIPLFRGDHETQLASLSILI